MTGVVRVFFEVARLGSDPDWRLFLGHSDLHFEDAKRRWGAVADEVRGFRAARAPDGKCLLALQFAPSRNIFLFATDGIDRGSASRLGREMANQDLEEFYPRILAEYSGAPPYSRRG